MNKSPQSGANGVGNGARGEGALFADDSTNGNLPAVMIQCGHHHRRFGGARWHPRSPRSRTSRQARGAKAGFGRPKGAGLQPGALIHCFPSLLVGLQPRKMPNRCGTRGSFKRVEQGPVWFLPPPMTFQPLKFVDQLAGQLAEGSVVGRFRLGDHVAAEAG